jgi:hypothetical protein
VVIAVSHSVKTKLFLVERAKYSTYVGKTLRAELNRAQNLRR